MDNKLLKLITLGVSAYYLIVYSCFQIYAKTFYLPLGAGAALMIWTFVVSLLTLAAGVFFLFRYRKERAAFMDDTGAIASSAVALAGGSVILAMMLLHIIHGLCYYDFGTLNLFFNPTGPLFSILFFMPFIVVAAVTIVKGFKIKGHGPFSMVSTGLCFMTTILFVLYTCFYELLAWLVVMTAFRQYESRPQELYWIFVQLVFIAVVLILFFAPLSFKNRFITDKSGGKKLTAQSFITVGIIILINTSIRILDYLISVAFFLISDFEEFIRDFVYIARERLAVQFLPNLIFLIVGFLAVFYGNKKGSQS
jgi:hypothetical protein